MAEMKHRYSSKQYLTVAAKERIKHKDFFHMKNLYILLHEWIVEEGWSTRSDPNFGEEFYLHRFTQEAGQELWIWWRFSKEITSYYRWDLDIDWHVIGLKDTEVMHNGEKFKANFGEVEFSVYAKQIADCNDTWKNHWLLKHIHPIFYKRIFRPELVKHKEELLREVQRLLSAIKTYCKLKNYLPEPEGQKFYTQKDFNISQ